MTWYSDRFKKFCYFLGGVLVGLFILAVALFEVQVWAPDALPYTQIYASMGMPAIVISMFLLFSGVVDNGIFKW